MVVYSYSHQVRPPAPYLEVEVVNPDSGMSRRLPAKIDTGASASVIPESLADDLELVPAGERLCFGYDGRSSIRPIYFGIIMVADETLEGVRLIATPRTDLLLGRDVLNEFNLILRGKDLTFEIVDP